MAVVNNGGGVATSLASDIYDAAAVKLTGIYHFLFVLPQRLHATRTTSQTLRTNLIQLLTAGRRIHKRLLFFIVMVYDGRAPLLRF